MRGLLRVATATGAATGGSSQEALSRSEIKSDASGRPQSTARDGGRLTASEEAEKPVTESKDYFSSKVRRFGADRRGEGEDSTKRTASTEKRGSVEDACFSRKIDGIIADLGVSSHHFDETERGFSFRGDGPLDMRMNRGRKLTAADVVNTYEPARLIAIFRDYGELPDPHKIAGRIAQSRREGPIQTTGELVEIVKPLTPKKDENRYLSQLFQALRIEVNGEMEALRMMLEQSLKVLRPGGRLVVISYHSLEDRIVKNFLRAGNFDGRVEKDFFGKPLTQWEIITRKAVTPTEEEVARNPRSRSAKLRAAVKL